MFEYNLSKHQNLLDAISVDSNHAEMVMLLKGYHLTTAEILYHLPDHPDILQTYIWQDYDLLPKFPVLSDFLIFWQQELDGKIYSVRLANRSSLKTSEINAVSNSINIGKPIFG